MFTHKLGAFKLVGLNSRFAAQAAFKCSIKSRPFSNLVKLSPRVREALKNHEPVVALESTIISHGMPYPNNYETAKVVESIIEKEGAVPATIALFDGSIHVGLTDDQIERLAKEGRSAVKASTRDIAMVLNQKKTGATTVSATMVCANLAKIKVFVTGGIGGVHRGAEKTMDVSADLTELGRTPVAVVCSGAKSILDLPKTLEYLETVGTPVVTFDKTTDFPAFFSRKSGLKSPWNLSSPKEAAEFIDIQYKLGLKNGIVFAVPIPEEFAEKGDEIELSIQQALEEAEKSGILGKEMTPFLLSKLVEITKGESLKANIALVKNNAKVGARISVDLAKLGAQSKRLFSTHIPRRSSHQAETSKLPQIVVFGGGTIDVVSRIDSDMTSISESESNSRKANDGTFQTNYSATSYMGRISSNFGGVGQNMARASHLLGANTIFVTVVGNDIYADAILNNMNDIGMNTQFVAKLNNCNTAVCNTVHKPGGDLIICVADTSIVEKMSPTMITSILEKSKPKLVAFDANILPEAMESIINYCSSKNIPTLYQPTSLPKAPRLLSTISTVGKGVDINTPNLLELNFMANQAVLRGLVSEPEDTKVIFHQNLEGLESEVVDNCILLSQLFKYQLITLGSNGILVVGKYSDGLHINHVPAIKATKILNTNGAGDSFVGSCLALLSKTKTFEGAAPTEIPFEDLCNISEKSRIASIMSMKSQSPVSELLSPDIFD